VDAVIHLAAYADYHLDFSSYVCTNLESIALLFELIVTDKLPIKKIVAASSQSVYGEGKYNCPEHGVIYPPPRASTQLERHDWEQYCPHCQNILTPLPEQEDDRLWPQIPYGITKQASEQLLMNLGKRYQIPVAVTRVSIAVGPYQSFRNFYSGAVRTFSVNALNKEPIQMNEDGKQSRDFVHVADVADAYLTLLNDSRANWQIFNIGNSTVTTVAELAKIVAEEAGVEFRPLFKNTYRLGDARHSLMDVSKLRALGWQPKHTLRQAVHDYLNWVRQYGNLKQAVEWTYADMQKSGVLHS
jgi:dTDP-L-rhamnose 4-epimerase